MNIKDLQEGSYTTVEPKPKLNVNNIQPGTFKVISGTPNIKPKDFKYDVAPAEVDKKQRLADANASAEQAKAEAKKARSFGGFMGNFGKALVENLAPSEVGLGKTIGKIAGTKYLDSYTKNVQDLSDSNIKIQKLIKEKEASGQDSSNLKRLFNSNVDLIAQNKKDIGEVSDLPSTTKVLGQLGGTALDVLTAGTYGKAKAGMTTGKLAPKATKPLVAGSTVAGIPELGKMAKQKATGLFTKKGLINVGKGASLGYANDVSMGLQGERGEDREGAKALIPGLGTALGATIPVLSEGTQTVKNLRDPEVKAQRLIKSRENELTKLDKLQVIKKATEKGRERGIDIKKVLSETDVLHGSVDKTGTITTKGDGGAVEQYTKEFIDGNEGIVSDLLKKEGRSISPALVKKRLTDAVMNAGIEGKALTQAKNAIDDEIAGYTMRAGANGVIPVETLHNAKIDKYNGINFFTEGNAKKYDKTIAKALKELVEENTSSVEIGKINKELSKHFAVIDYLNKLDGKKVDGGKLGKYFASTVGAIVGSHFGPLGAIAGAEAGGRVKGNMMSRAFGGKTGKIAPQAEVITEALKVKGEAPLQLGQASNSLGSLKTTQTTTIPSTINPGMDNIIPPSIPKGKGETPKLSQEITGNRITDPNKFERATGLTTENKTLEDRAFDHVIKNEDQILKDYFAKHGKVINADNFRPFFKDQGYTGRLSAGVQEPSSYLAKRARTIALKNPGNYVVGTAGGSGSGKTSAIDAIPKIKKLADDSAMILDSNFSKLSSALNFINEAKKQGKEFLGVFTYRDFMDSLENGVVKRMLTNKDEMGRVVPNKVTVGNHVDSWEVIKKLVKDHDIIFEFIDNSLGAGKAKLVTLDELEKKIKYADKSKMLEEANNKIKELYETKKPFVDKEGNEYYVSKEQYDALVG